MKRGEKGFTLIEALITIAITGVIIGPLMMATMTLMTYPQRSTDQNIVLQQVRNASHWISRDVQMARSVNSTDPNGFPVTFSMPVDTDENNDYSIVYLFDGNKLKREVYDSLHTLTAESFVAEYIDVANTTFSTTEPNNYMLMLKAAKGKVVVERSYEIMQRLGSG